MSDKNLVVDTINRSAENEAGRRSFLRNAGLAGLGVIGTSALAGAGGTTASAAPVGGPSDTALLNFLLNVEYLTAEFYLHAIWERSLPNRLTTGTGTRGSVTGGHRAPFRWDSIFKHYSREIAQDQENHVVFLRKTLGSSAVARPAIDLETSFTTAARAAGLVSAAETFDAFRTEDNFLLAAFLLSDLSVTAYKGAIALIANRAHVDAATGVAMVESYHASLIRTSLYARKLYSSTQKLSDLRDALDGPSEKDSGIGDSFRGNLTPADSNSMVRGRGPGDVLNILYLTSGVATEGGFFPAGVNGELNRSDNNA